MLQAFSTQMIILLSNLEGQVADLVAAQSVEAKQEALKVLENSIAFMTQMASEAAKETGAKEDDPGSASLCQPS